MNTFGMICILVSTSVCGFYIGGLYDKRLKQLRDLKQGLKMFETELLYGHTPLHKAMENSSRNLSTPISEFFYDFSIRIQEKDYDVSMAWEDSLKKIWSTTALKSQDYHILITFGQSLGKYDLYSEEKNIKFTLQKLANEEEKALHQANNESKLMRSLGVLVGLLIVILLI